MTDRELAEIVANSIDKTGVENNELIGILREILKINRNVFGSVTPQRFKYFSDMIDGGDIELEGDEDFKPMATSGYWNQPDNISFAYVARILPKIRTSYPRSYKKVFNGTNLLPAGLDDESKKNPNKPTIWNEVEKVDTDKVSGKSGYSKKYRTMA